MFISKACFLHSHVIYVMTFGLLMSSWKIWDQNFENLKKREWKHCCWGCAYLVSRNL